MAGQLGVGVDLLPSCLVTDMQTKIVALCISLSHLPPLYLSIYLILPLLLSYASTFEENRIGKDMLLDLDKVSKVQVQYMQYTHTVLLQC